MQPLKAYRRSRYLTQEEMAKLLGRSVIRIQQLEAERVGEPTLLMWRYIEACEEQLDLGPHPFVKPRYFNPEKDPWSMIPPCRIKRLQAVGRKHMTLEYPPLHLERPVHRHDLRVMLRENACRRVLILWARGEHGWEVIDVKVPKWPPP